MPRLLAFALVLLVGCAQSSAETEIDEPVDAAVEAEAKPPSREPNASVEAEPEDEAEAEPSSTDAPDRAGHLVRPSNAPVTEPTGIPRIQHEPPVVGTDQSEVIRRVVRANIEGVRECYDAGIARDPELAGYVEIEFTIGPSGAVVSAKATPSPDFSDPEVPKCIAHAIETWVFPEPRGGGSITVRYPFNLAAG